MEKKRERYIIEDILIILFKHKYKIVAAFFTVMVAVTVKTALTKPVYQTTSSMMVQSGRESISRGEVGDDGDRVVLGLDYLLNTESRILTSADLIEKVITNIGIKYIYPDMIEPSPKETESTKEASIDEYTLKAATFRFQNNLGASPAKGSNVINVFFKHNDPLVAAQAVNQLIESFKLKHIEIFKNPRASFMEKQLAVYRQRMEESENKLEAFKEKNGVFSLTEQRTHLLAQKTGLDTSLKETKRNIQKLEQQISSLTSQMQSIPKYELTATNTSKTNNKGEAQSKLLELRLREQELVAKYDGSNRNIAKVRKEIQLVEDFLASSGFAATGESESLAKNNLYLGLEAKLLDSQTALSSTKASSAAMEQQLNQISSELLVLDSHERGLRNLERELRTNETNFSNYVNKLEDARTEEELDLMRQVNISIIQKATVPLYPIEPNKRLNLLVGIVLGLVSGLALALFSEYCIGRGVCTPEGAEQHLGLPVLAAVPYKEGKNQRVAFAMMTLASLFLLMILLNGCSTATKSPTPFNPRVVEEPSDFIPKYKIHADDQLEIKFFYNTEFNDTVKVRPDGRITLQLINDVMAAGLSSAELTDILKEKYSSHFVDPQITVIIRDYGGNRVYVDGEVGKKSMYTLGPGYTVSQIIAQAGGLLDTARRAEVRVIRRKADKKPLVIPVNLKQVYNGTDIKQDIALQPYDIVYVPKSAIANVNLWANQYIYNNFRIGFGYSINSWFWE